MLIYPRTSDRHTTEPPADHQISHQFDESHREHEYGSLRNGNSPLVEVGILSNTAPLKSPYDDRKMRTPNPSLTIEAR